MVAGRSLMHRWMVLVMLCAGLAATVPALADDAREEDKKQLGALLRVVEQNLNDQDIDALVHHLSPDVTVTWLSGEITHGRDAVSAHLHKMLVGPDAVVAAYRAKPVGVGEPRFFDDLALAFGTSEDAFKMPNGFSFALHTRWTALSIKENGTWRVLALHLSSNVFDNDLIAQGKRAGWLIGLGGFVLGALLTLLLRRRRAG